MIVNIFPTTKLGKWSVGLIISFFIFLGIFFQVIRFGERGGDTFFSNPNLAVPILIAAASAISSFYTGIVSVVKNRERSLLVFLALPVGLFVQIFILGEILTPH